MKRIICIFLLLALVPCAMSDGADLEAFIADYEEAPESSRLTVAYRAYNTLGEEAVGALIDLFGQEESPAGERAVLLKDMAIHVSMAQSGGWTAIFRCFASAETSDELREKMMDGFFRPNDPNYAFTLNQILGACGLTIPEIQALGIGKYMKGGTSGLAAAWIKEDINNWPEALAWLEPGEWANPEQLPHTLVPVPDEILNEHANRAGSLALYKDGEQVSYAMGAMAHIPQNLRAQEPGKAEMVLVIEALKTEAGKYVDGSGAYRMDLKLSVYAAKDGSLVFEQTVQGEDPAATKRLLDSGIGSANVQAMYEAIGAYVLAAGGQ